jgi:hypothetical protein
LPMSVGSAPALMRVPAEPNHVTRGAYRSTGSLDR